MTTYTRDSAAEQIAADCAAQIAGKTILVTGAAPAGLGGAFSNVIAKHKPACVILTSRDATKAQKSADNVSAIDPSIRTHSLSIDLSSIESVRASIDTINSYGETIDVIVNNAGIMAPSYGLSADGIEVHFAANHIGHFLLVNLLLPKILARGKPLRIVNVASSGHRYSPVRFEDINFDDGKVYNKWIAYGQSKTGNMLFSRSLAKKLGSRGVFSFSVHPGIIQGTEVLRHVKPEELSELSVLDQRFGYRYWLERVSEDFKAMSQGVATHVFAAFHPSLDSTELNGSYLANSRVQTAEEVFCWARDAVDAERLWKLSEKLVGQEFAY